MLGIGSDHGGYQLKQAIMKHLEARGIAFTDYGTYGEESCDYPEYGRAVALAVAGGISIAANKIPGIRAAVCGDCFSAEATRAHNDANILALGARVVGEGLALKIVDTFLDTPFSNDERHIRRIRKIEG